MSRHQNNATILKYDAYCITEDDIHCLDDHEYVNDNIINLWLNYMYNTLVDNSQRPRIHICDTYFMLGLEILHLESSNQLERRMKPLHTDFVVIPVNVGNHWFLVTWEYPANAYNEEAYNEQLFRSRLRFYDSMGEDYLQKEKTKIYNTLTKFIRKTIVLKNDGPISDDVQVAVRHEKVYQQKNLFDCGIHLLTNAEGFILSAQDKTSNDVKQDESILLLKISRAKRHDMKNFIRKMVENFAKI